MLEPMVGQVLPMAWNMDDAEKITAFAAKFQELTMRKCTPMATTAASLVNTRMSHSASNWQIAVNMSISATPMITDHLKVSRTRSGLRAPKFCPAMGAAANDTAMAGSMMDCITRCPTPKPAWAAAPKSRITQ
jgi:hypothetical protein